MVTYNCLHGPGLLVYTPTVGTVCVQGVYCYLSFLANARCSGYVYLTFSSLPLSPPPPPPLHPCSHSLVYITLKEYTPPVSTPLLMWCAEAEVLVRKLSQLIPLR